MSNSWQSQNRVEGWSGPGLLHHRWGSWSLGCNSHGSPEREVPERGCRCFSHSVASFSLQPRALQQQASLTFTVSQVGSDSCPLSQRCCLTARPLSPPPPFAFSLCQHQGLLQWVNSSYQVAKVLEFQLQHQSFQYHNSKASILRCSAFFIVQLSHPYTTTGKTIALTRQSFVRKVMSLLINMLSRLVITFLPRSKHLLMS